MIFISSSFFNSRLENRLNLLELKPSVQITYTRNFELFHLPVTREQAIKFVDKSPFDPIWFWDFIDEKNVSCDVKTLVDLNKEIFWNLERECVYCYGVREN